MELSSSFTRIKYLHRIRERKEFFNAIHRVNDEGRGMRVLSVYSFSLLIWGNKVCCMFTSHEKSFKVKNAVSSQSMFSTWLKNDVNIYKRKIFQPKISKISLNRWQERKRIKRHACGMGLENCASRMSGARKRVWPASTKCFSSCLNLRDRILRLSVGWAQRSN